MKKQTQGILFSVLVGVFTHAEAAEPTVSSASLQVASSAGGAYGNSATSELFFIIEQLQSEVQSLRGTVEELQHEVSILKKQGRERYLDLDQRILDLSKVVPATSSAQTAALPAHSSEVAPKTSDKSNEVGVVVSSSSIKSQEEAYQKAYDLIKLKKFDEATDALHQFITAYPENDLTVNAYYWLGEVYLVMPKLEQSKQAFTVVISKYPNHRKASDAMYKLGIVYDRLGDKANAKQYLNEVQAKYPGTSAAKLANDHKL